MGLLRDLKSLEDLEFEGEYGHALGRLGHYVARGAISLRIQTLTVRRGEDERRQALRLKRLLDTARRDLDLRPRSWRSGMKRGGDRCRWFG